VKKRRLIFTSRTPLREKSEN